MSKPINTANTDKSAIVAEVLNTLANVNSASGRVKTKDNQTEGILTLSTTEGVTLDLTLTQFDNIYRSFVKCWPTVKPLKEEVVIKQKEETTAAKSAEREKAAEAKKVEREAAKAATKAERDAAKGKADAERAKVKADKAEKAKAEKEAKEAQKKAAAEAKKLADTAKLKAAAEAKDKKDKAAAGEGPDPKGSATTEKAIDKGNAKAAKK